MMALPEALVLFHLFGFLPVLLIGGVLWYERVRRMGARRRTRSLLASLALVAAAGVLQTGAWLVRDLVPSVWPRAFVLSGLAYFFAFFLLEFAIHVARIEESFLLDDFRQEVRGLAPWLGVAGALAVVVVVGLFPTVLRYLVGAFALALIVVDGWTAWRVFNLQDGVIRQRGYPFYVQGGLTLVLGVGFVAAPTEGLGDPWLWALPWFLLFNAAYLLRLLEEFFFWSQYNLRSDLAKLELRQNTQNLLIRRVIGSVGEDNVLIREVVESALEKVRGRMVVQEYRITGVAVYRVTGAALRVEDPGHVIGYCTPLSDNKSFKTLDKQQLTDQIVRTAYDLSEVRNTPSEGLKDFGKRLVHQALSTKRLVVSADLPDGLKGLQRLAAVMPVFDADTLLGCLIVFKDSFDKLYPSEKDVLGELAENLATIWALMAGKEVQRERNRLQGELQLATTIQTSLLPVNPSVPGFRVATYMETATEVGGDVFDFVPTPFGTYVGIGDVAGHGLPAGMMALISVAALHGVLDASRQTGQPLPLDQVYDGVNRVLCTLNRDRIGSDKFMTQNHFLIEGNQISYVGTHLVAALWRARTQSIEELTELTNRTGFLGLSEHIASAPSLGAFAMDAGDVLVLYSDGVSEAKNAGGTLYGLGGIKAVLARHADDAEALVARLLEDLKRHAASGDLIRHGGRYADDITLVVLQKE